jgi:hypothetical protein
MTSGEATIVPITLTIGGRTGLTLWAPPWEDEDGEEWQGFLGDGAKILLYPGTRELADFVASGDENDLSDHPAWGRVMKLAPDDLRPTADDIYNLDQVYDWAADEPDPATVSALANVVDMVEKIADSCDDGALRRLVGSTPEYAELVSDDVSYQGKDGRKRWNELGDVIAETWERALSRVESWLRWEGDFAESESEVEAESVWDRVGAEPIEIVLEDATYLTVRGEVDGKPAFLGEEDDVAVFTDPADLARFCRKAKEHALVKLEGWTELAEASDDAFEPEESFDLREPSSDGADLLRDLVAFCDLSADADDLDDPIDPHRWADVVAEVETCFRRP